MHQQPIPLPDAQRAQALDNLIERYFEHEKNPWLPFSCHLSPLTTFSLMACLRIAFSLIAFLAIIFPHQTKLV